MMAGAPPVAPRPWRTRRGPRRAAAAFTLVEGLVAAAVAAVLFVGVAGFFGDLTRRFTHQEDTLSSAHQAQLLLEYLRRDIRHLDGYPDDATRSADSETGTTYTKFWVHALHVPGGSRLELFPHRKQSAADPLPADHPATQGLQASGPETDRLRQRLSRIENAFAWVREGSADGDSPRHLVLNVREGDQLVRVRYVYDPKATSITRYGAGAPVRIAAPAMQNFRATPVIELIHDPADPGFVPRLGKTWLEVEFDLAAEGGGSGGKPIRSRHVAFSTRLLPFHLNTSLRSDWSP